MSPQPGVALYGLAAPELMVAVTDSAKPNNNLVTLMLYFSLLYHRNTPRQLVLQHYPDMKRALIGPVSDQLAAFIPRIIPQAVAMLPL